MDIKIKEDGVDKVFVINQLKATEAMGLINRLGGLLSQTDAITPDVFMQFIYIKSNSGIEIPGVDQKKLNALFKEDLLKIFCMVLQSALLGITDEKQHDLLVQVSKCIVFKNGILDVQLDMVPGSERHIDNYVKKPATLYRLFLEVVKLHCADFFIMTAE